jgi:RNA polymerase sigma-70 factor (ECF subfamily)
MDQHDWLMERFEANRPHLRAVAYRMLGSLGDADDAVQDARLRLTDTSGVENVGVWLTTAVARVCLDITRSRQSRRADSLDARVPDPIVGRENGIDPQDDAVLADSVGVALLVVLETLTPAERLAFVLHDMFAVPFDDIAPMLARSPTATRQLASRARRRVRGAAAAPDPDVARQREVVDAFFAAARRGDFDALVAVLDPDVVARTDGGPGASAIVRGAHVVGERAIMFARPSATLRPAQVNGAAGVVITIDGRLASVMAFAVRDGKIVEIDALTDPERLGKLDLAALGD